MDPVVTVVTAHTGDVSNNNTIATILFIWTSSLCVVYTRMDTWPRDYTTAVRKHVAVSAPPELQTIAAQFIVDWDRMEQDSLTAGRAGAVRSVGGMGVPCIAT
jgi:hypothetical protein